MQGFRTRPKAFNHFWPRLWSTAKPLGVEARRAKEKGPVPGLSVEEDVDSRIFVQGGRWISKHAHLLTDVEGATSSDRATCVLFMKGSKLYGQFCPDNFNDEMIQGVLESVSEDRSQCVLQVYEDEKSDSESEDTDLDSKGPQTKVNTALTNPDIFWCIPYWVAAEYKLHLEKIPVERGYYFLVNPGKAFCIVSVSWAKDDVLVDAEVDGELCSKTKWLLDPDGDPILFTMFEFGKRGAVLKGKQLTFTRRKTSEQPSTGWQEEVSLCGSVVVTIHRALGADESESETEGEASDDESAGSAEDSSPASGKGAACVNRSGRAAPAAVKRDSKWAMHLSIAPARGPETEAPSYGFTDKNTGRRLGCNVLHYRGPEWFQTIDLMLQETSMRESRMKKNASIVVGEVRSPEGATKDTAICLDDSPIRSSPSPGAQAQGGPIRKSKALMVSYHEGGTGILAKHVVLVPKTHSVATFKSLVRDALADEDLVGEGIRTAKLRWTYLECNGCEVDISPFTEASDLESSPTLHVYALSKI